MQLPTINTSTAISHPRGEFDEDATIRVRDLSVTYHKRPALCNVGLDIFRNRITALIGPSGCGKTTFLNCLNRMTDLIDGCSVDGSVEFEGNDILSPTVDARSLRKNVGMIFQRPNPFALSIRANLHLPLRSHGIRKRAERDAMMEGALRDVGLWDEVGTRLHKSAVTLSGGQQQRLCIARALVLQPRVLLLDEPCSALDPLAAETVEKLIAGLRERYTVIIVTHNLAQARRLADDVAIFWSRGDCVQQRCGTLIETGPAAVVFENPQDTDAVAYLRGLRG